MPRGQKQDQPTDAPSFSYRVAVGQIFEGHLPQSLDGRGCYIIVRPTRQQTHEQRNAGALTNSVLAFPVWPARDVGGRDDDTLVITALLLRIYFHLPCSPATSACGAARLATRLATSFAPFLAPHLAVPC